MLHTIDMSDSTTMRTAQMLSVTSALLLSGANLGSSFITLPYLYSMPPPVSTVFFKDFYLAGKNTLVPLCIFSASCSALAAYLRPEQRSLWGTAGIITASHVPFTILMLAGTNSRLCEIADSKTLQATAGKEVVALLKKWATLNTLRAGLALGGGLVGLWAVANDKPV